MPLFIRINLLEKEIELIMVGKIKIIESNDEILKKEKDKLEKQLFEQEKVFQKEKSELVKKISEQEKVFQKKISEQEEVFQKKIAEMEEMLKQLTENQVKTIELQPEVENDYPDIPTNRPIKVMSLFTGGLNLKTSNDGTAQTFRLEKFGDIIPIMYMDLSKIISNQRWVFEEGYGIIMDKDVIKLHYFEDAMKRILDHKTITNILNYEIEKIKTLFSGSTKVIQQTIVDLLIEKINNGEYIDRNKISVISDIFGYDVYELANRVK